MVQVNAMARRTYRSGGPFGRHPATSNSTRTGPNWITVLKVVLIIVAVAAAVYFAHTVVIPAVASMVAKAQAVASAVGTAVTDTALTATKISGVAAKAAHFGISGGTVAIGGGKTAIWAGANAFNTILLKPFRAIKYVIDASAELTKVQAIPFAAAGGGGFAW